MWIVSKRGLFNTDNIERIEGYGDGTYAYSHGKSHMISDKPVVADILTALEDRCEILLLKED